MRKSKRYLVYWTSLLILVLAVGLVGCGTKTVDTKPTLVFADAGWDSIQFHNSVAQLIIEEGYGYETDFITGSTPITFLGLVQGDIDIYTEIWTDNLREAYDEAIENGDINVLSVNFDDNVQGLYVPTYLIKGDPERGIEPLAPDLKSIHDLPQYWELFKDPEKPSKGRMYGAIPGWAADEMLSTKFKSYDLGEYYTYFSPGSDTALATSMTKAYEEGEPWLGYYWEPTWIMGKYDMTLLEDTPFDEELWNDGYQCEFPASDVTVGVHKDMETKAPEVVEFLSHYKTSSALTNKALAYMKENDATTDEAAQWFLKTHTDLWSPWVPSEIAEKVKAALK